VALFKITVFIPLVVALSNILIFLLVFQIDSRGHDCDLRFITKFIFNQNTVNSLYSSISYECRYGSYSQGLKTPNICHLIVNVIISMFCSYKFN